MAELQFVIRIEAMPSLDDQQGLLEFVLAAASLEVRAKVLMNADALRLFDLSSTRGWRQLIDQSLVEVLVVDAPAGIDLYDGIERLAPADLDRLVENSTVIQV